MLAADQVGVAALTDRKGGSLANRWDRVRVARWAYLLAALAIAIGVRWLTRPLCRAARAPLAVLPVLSRLMFRTLREPAVIVPTAAQLNPR